MKLYHGTSFESAVKIFSGEYWVHEHGILCQHMYEFCKEQGLKMKPYDFDAGERFRYICFSGSLDVAAFYANMNSKPVVICWETDNFKEEYFGNQWMIRVFEKIPVSELHCVTGDDYKTGMYGHIVNTIYNNEAQIYLSANRGCSMVFAVKDAESMCSILSDFIECGLDEDANDEILKNGISLTIERLKKIFIC